MKDGLYETLKTPPLTTWLLAGMLPMAVVANCVPNSDMVVGIFVLIGGFIGLQRIALWGWARVKIAMQNDYRAREDATGRRQDY